MNKHMFAILSDEQNVTVWKLTIFAIVRKHRVSTAAVLMKEHVKNVNKKTYLEIEVDQRSTKNHSTTV